ncbi:NitT/TauT family transport system substrate-binding protein [Bradyrhizobium daqingense]|uniref:NitT/TauT family transport system substrate-binding protein n=2 Tax=Nitrobacteraceae TaxID=41294 RepID=A0A562KVQ8_9BRAD|nr:NitT/TauT family transport system substrate-binding protein [Bradyrhizobium daqingense]
MSGPVGRPKSGSKLLKAQEQTSFIEAPWENGFLVKRGEQVRFFRKWRSDISSLDRLIDFLKCAAWLVVSPRANWNSRDVNMNRSRLLQAALALIITLGGANGVRAETGQLRIAQQFGIAYLPLIVASEKGLIEEEAKALGIAPPKIEWLRLSGAAAMNEALISGGLDFATAGITPMILTWDKTRTTAKIIGVAALGSMANILTTNNPNIKTLADFTEKDRIALPSVKVGFQPIVLQMAADKAFGKYDKLDELTVSMPHPDATAQILSGHSEITAHFTSPPFSQQQLASGKVHQVLNSYDVLGGPHTFNVVYSTTKFVNDNPKTILAFVRGLDRANEWIKANPKDAAALYIKAEGSKLAPDFVESIIRDKDVNFTTAPEGAQKFADFEAKVGLIKQAPASWRDLFWSGLGEKPGS